MPVAGPRRAGPPWARPAPRPASPAGRLRRTKDRLCGARPPGGSTARPPPAFVALSRVPPLRRRRPRPGPALRAPRASPRIPPSPPLWPVRSPFIVRAELTAPAPEPSAPPAHPGSRPPLPPGPPPGLSRSPVASAFPRQVPAPCAVQMLPGSFSPNPGWAGPRARVWPGRATRGWEDLSADPSPPAAQEPPRCHHGVP